MSAADLVSHLESLPEPGRDERPPAVLASGEDQIAARAQRKFEKSLLKPKLHTEEAAQYILQGHLFRGYFRKDGDWQALADGRRVWQKKVADYYGSVPMKGQDNPPFVYVEVKAVSPGQSFSFLRLDKRNNPSQPSQHEKLTAEMKRKRIVWLAIGWWDKLPGHTFTVLKKKGREYKKWRKEDVVMTLTLLRWSDWLNIYTTHNYRSIRQKDRCLLDHCRIFKRNGRWTLCDNHWWNNYR